MHLTPLFPFGNQSERPDLWHGRATLAREGGCLHFVSDRGGEARMQRQKGSARFCRRLSPRFCGLKPRRATQTGIQTLAKSYRICHSAFPCRESGITGSAQKAVLVPNMSFLQFSSFLRPRKQSIGSLKSRHLPPDSSTAQTLSISKVSKTEVNCPLAVDSPMHRVQDGFLEFHPLLQAVLGDREGGESEGGRDC